MSRGTVYILGAGASFGSSLPFPRPPLISNFMETAKRVGAWDRATEQGLHNLWNQIEKELGLDLRNGILPNIEELIGLVDGQIASHPSEISKKAYAFHRVRNGLQDFVFDTLFETTRSLRENTCRWHDEIAKRLAPGDAIVSFNYDLIMEHSLRKHCESWRDRRWIKGYGVDFDYFETESFLSGLPEPGVLLLKPHGSVGWRFDTGNRGGWDGAYTHEISRQESEAGKSTLRDLVTSLTEESAKSTNPENGQTNYFRRGVIIPSPFKLLSEEFRLHRLFFERIRQRMKNTLESADEVVVIGFSLGSNDQDMRNLIMEATAVWESDRVRLILVTPDNESAERTVKAFGQEPAARFHYLEEYARSLHGAVSRVSR